MLAELRPRRKYLVYDLVEQAGFDVSDWKASARDPRKVKANPKYCYEWSYVSPGKLIILNLWHQTLVEDDAGIAYRANFRTDAAFHRSTPGRQAWAARAQRLDKAVETAFREDLPVRVIVISGAPRPRETADAAPSHVTGRELDPETWAVTKYDVMTGDFEVRRGAAAQRYVDQFDLSTTSIPERLEVTGFRFNRDPAVRRKALLRAAGRCELCGRFGFKMDDGALYLETHHIIPLSEGGADEERNVAALCADDHRRAHFAEDRANIRQRLERRFD